MWSGEPVMSTVSNTENRLTAVYCQQCHICLLLEKVAYRKSQQQRQPRDEDYAVAGGQSAHPRW